jgi:spore coat assembly protein
MLGDYVTQIDDKTHIIYEVTKEDSETAEIKGINYRIVKIVPLSSLTKADIKDIKNENERSSKYYYKIVNSKTRMEKRYILGTILHIDGDNTYLSKCLELYEALGIFAYGVRIDEDKMKIEIEKILKQITPDIIVITGHDSYNNKGLSDLENYKNTIHFMETIKVIKRCNNNSCIIAGACQSNFEALMASGASFASSPKRINIHTFDPAVVAVKVATTSFVKIVDFDGIIKFIEEGRKAFGGVETFGKMRMLL